MATLNLRVSKKTTAAIEHKINKTTFLSSISRVTTDQTKAVFKEVKEEVPTVSLLS